MRNLSSQLLFFFILILSITEGKCQNTFSYQGKWRYSTESSNFLIELFPKYYGQTAMLVGTHCSVALSGDKIDCNIANDAYGDSYLSLMGPRFNNDAEPIEIMFTSDFCNCTGRAVIKRISDNEIEWRVIQAPPGENYFPELVILKRDCGGLGIPACPSCLTSKEDLKKVFPNASDATLNKVVIILNKYGKTFGIDTKEKLHHFLAQAGHESGGLTNLGIREDMNYTKETLINTFGFYFSETDPDKKNPTNYVGDKEKIANIVYADRLGNTSTGDGYKFIGRGILKITGRTNYQAFQDYYNGISESKIDLISNPDLLFSNDELAIMSALWFYKANVLNIITIDSDTDADRISKVIINNVEIVTIVSDLDLVDRISKIINGGSIGKAEKRSLYNQAKIHIKCF